MLLSFSGIWQQMVSLIPVGTTVYITADNQLRYMYIHVKLLVESHCHFLPFWKGGNAKERQWGWSTEGKEARQRICRAAVTCSTISQARSSRKFPWHSEIASFRQPGSQNWAALRTPHAPGGEMAAWFVLTWLYSGEKWRTSQAYTNCIIKPIKTPTYYSMKCY